MQTHYEISEQLKENTPNFYCLMCKLLCMGREGWWLLATRHLGHLTLSLGKRGSMIARRPFGVSWDQDVVRGKP